MVAKGEASRGEMDYEFGISRWKLIYTGWINNKALLLLLPLLSRFSRVWLCATPQTTAHQAPPSLGFSRQEHWSGLPFPSPMRESEVAQSCPTLCNPMDCSPPGSSVHGIFQARVLEWGAIAFSNCFLLLHYLSDICTLFEVIFKPRKWSGWHIFIKKLCVLRI